MPLLAQGMVPVLYYKNTGTSSAPVFTAQTGVNNPLNGTFFYYGCAPTICGYR